MGPLNHKGSYATIHKDLSRDYAGWRSENLVGSIRNDPLMNRELQRANCAIQLWSETEALAAADRQTRSHSHPFFNALNSIFYSKRKDDEIEAATERASRELKDVRKTITIQASERERFPEVCGYAFGEEYEAAFDLPGPQCTIKFDMKQFTSGVSASKECNYERSRLLRYLSLKVMEVSGKFSVYHHPGKAAGRSYTVSDSDYNDLSSRWGASRTAEGMTKSIMGLLNRTIELSHEYQSIGESFDHVTIFAKDTIMKYGEVMHLDMSDRAAVETQRVETEKMTSSWRNALDVIADSDLTPCNSKWSRHAQPNQEKDRYDYASLEDVLRQELNLEILYEGPPQPLELECMDHERGAFGNTEKFLLQEPREFARVSWPVAELAVKTIFEPKSKSVTSTRQERMRRHCKRIVRELRAWCEMRHECIVPILGLWKNKEDGVLFCAVAPWISEGQLDHYMGDRKPGRLESLLLMHDIGSALDYMHNMVHGVVHGDLKPDNVLVRNGRALLADFGLSHIMDDVEGFTSEVHGCSMWLAPEVIAAKALRTSESQPFKPSFSQDVYSFGCLFLFVIYNEEPFEKLGYSSDRLAAKRSDHLSDLPIRRDSRRYADYYQFMIECWRFNPMLRITAKLALQYIEQFVDAQTCNASRDSCVVEPVLLTTAIHSPAMKPSKDYRLTVNTRRPYGIPLKSDASVRKSADVAVGCITR